MKTPPISIKTYSLRYLAIIFLSVFLTACGGLPEEYVKQAESIATNFEANKKQIENKKNQNLNYLKSEKGQFLQPYAKQENWNKFFSIAQQTLNQAQQNYQKIITPLLEKNDEKDEVALRVAIIRINKLIVQSEKDAKQASLRADFLVKAKDNASQYAVTSKELITQIDVLLNSAQQFIEKPAIDYPAKAYDIEKRYQILDKLRKNAHQSLSTATIELEKLSSNDINYAIFADNVKNISDLHKQLNADVPALKNKLQELYRSYSKTLTDMRIDYFVQIGRTSWDNYYDYPTEHTQHFTSKVAKEVASYFDSLAEGKLAWTNSSGSLRLYIDKRMWSALKIVPHSSWSSGDDEGEFWVNNVIFKYYHKYVITENQSQKEVDWQAVKEDYYWQNEKNLGLTIVSKPYGKYEDETIKKATPPGMEYIAKPIMVNGKPTGSNQYGEWRQNSSGTSFWHYYIAYSFMRSMVGNPYSYNNYNHYASRNSNTGYYGSNNRYGTYGSSTYNNSRYKNSTYSRQNPSVKTANGRKRLQTASVRSSGPKSRGRGPSGGGK